LSIQNARDSSTENRTTTNDHQRPTMRRGDSSSAILRRQVIGRYDQRVSVLGHYGSLILKTSKDFPLLRMKSSGPGQTRLARR
jgi:hypothetical protein